LTNFQKITILIGLIKVSTAKVRLK
jgi:hypothetical protein